MVDRDEMGGVADEELLDPSSGSGHLWTLAGMVFDGVVASAAGLVGSALLTVALVAAAAVGGFDFESFLGLADLVGATAVLGPERAVAGGYALFLASGMTVWPLLLASLARYLPGESFAAKGAVFGGLLWAWFAIAFYDGSTGLSLAVYAAATLVGHLGYGFVLGRVFDYLGGRATTLARR
jgi:hypothetical protein